MTTFNATLVELARLSMLADDDTWIWGAAFRDFIKQHRATLANAVEMHRDALMADRAAVGCPQCGEDCQYLTPFQAEPDTGTTEWAGGYHCGCGWKVENQPREVDE